MGRIRGHRNAKPGGGKQVCLRCDREFTSLGEHNRICTDCRVINEGIGGRCYRVHMGKGKVGAP